MDLHDLLVVILIFLVATGICVTLFNRLGLGTIVGFIVTGIIIGPNTPGPVASTQVAQLHHVSELGIVLFMFVVGLELPPRHLWDMRKQLIGLGGSQIVLSSIGLGLLLTFAFSLKLETAVVVGLGLALSSTAVILTILSNTGQMATRHGRSIFAILMAQDVAIIPILALVPIIAQVQAKGQEQPLILKVLFVIGALLGVFVLGQFLLPRLMSWTVKKRSRETFGILVFLSVLASAWVADLAGLSMTLGAFFLGILLSMSDYRYLIEDFVEHFRTILMGLFFIAVGMSIDVQALFEIWPQIILLAAAVMAIKTIVLVALCRISAHDWATSIRTGFALSQVGELAFILYSEAAGFGLIAEKGLTIGYLIISITMILTPLMLKLGDRLATRFEKADAIEPGQAAQELSDHLVIVGVNDVGSIAALVAERAEIPYIALDDRLETVRRAKQAGVKVLFGDIRMDPVQHAAALERARAVFLSTKDKKTLRSVAVTLRQLYPELRIHAQVSTLKDAADLHEKGIQSASAIFVESTLSMGKEMMKVFGVPEEQADELINEMQHNDYALIRQTLV